MRYRIQHHTHYRYSQPVTLQPHTFNLRPRSDGSQTLSQFELSIQPLPERQATLLTLDGNSVVRAWFEPAPTPELVIKASAEVETHCPNPFNYLAEPWAATVPLDYPTSLAAQLYPYLYTPFYPAPAPAVSELAHALIHEVQGNVGLFLTGLNQRIYSSCQYTVRESGDPLPAGITWSQKLGSCRDFTCLFMEACRSVGLAARFVSGYEAGDPGIAERDLHAWAEVYIPGGGWRGFDPTTGLAVADRHVALVASPFPQQTVPVIGATQEGGRVPGRLETHVTMEILG